MKIITSFLLGTLTLLAFSSSVVAQSIEACSDRYVTLVNPVRGRNLMSSNNSVDIVKQKQASFKYGFPVTWLIQYDVLEDKELLGYIKSFGDTDEKGLFLEVSEVLADVSGVGYLKNIKWSDPGKIFLSAYSQSERRGLIDAAYQKFKETFGYYPKSVGAWWIDSYSLNYIEKKYGLSAVLIVADQRSTDSYGVWGQWWGVPYYPSKSNVLVSGLPGESLDAVVVQWAQRDPILAYGDGSSFSNYSLQANDYIRSGKDIEYFKYLANRYLDCRNNVGQLTIGMETGMEAAAFQEEYEKQLEYLSTSPEIKAVTMSEFYEVFKKVNPENPKRAFIGDWQMNLNYRSNETLSERINYPQGVAFGDYFIADKKPFLNRNLSEIKNSASNYPFPWFLVVCGILAFFLIIKKKLIPLFWSILFGLSAYGLLFLSRYKYGWGVVFGPFDENFPLLQILIAAAIVFIATALFSKRLKVPKLLVWLIPLSYSMDRILELAAYSKINGANLFGFFVKNTKFAGISFGKEIHLVLNKFSFDAREAFLRIPMEKFTENKIFYILLGPVMHLLLAALLYLIIKKIPPIPRFCVILILALMLCVHIFMTINTDPISAFPVK